MNRLEYTNVPAVITLKSTRRRDAEIRDPGGIFKDSDLIANLQEVLSAWGLTLYVDVQTYASETRARISHHEEIPGRRFTPDSKIVNKLYQAGYTYVNSGEEVETTVIKRLKNGGQGGGARGYIDWDQAHSLISTNRSMSTQEKAALGRLYMAAKSEGAFMSDKDWQNYWQERSAHLQSKLTNQGADSQHQLHSFVAHELGEFLPIDESRVNYLFENSGLVRQEFEVPILTFNHPEKNHTVYYNPSAHVVFIESEPIEILQPTEILSEAEINLLEQGEAGLTRDLRIVRMQAADKLRRYHTAYRVDAFLTQLVGEAMLLDLKQQ